MKKTAYLLVLILLTIVSGCNLFKPDDDDPDDGWLNIAPFDFPVYVGHFADYEHTDASGNHLGSITYGEGGDANDWIVFEFAATDKSVESLRGLVTPREPKDPYYICVKAFDAETNVELAATILLNNSPTGFTTPYTFSHTGSYDPALEELYTVDDWYYIFPSTPDVVFNAETNTYTYNFNGFPQHIEPFFYFIATLTEQNHVLLTWVTESETQVSGFRLYRSNSNDISSAIAITPELIPSTNTNQQHTYTFTDTAVELGSTYFYWLEMVFIENTPNYYGPVSISLLPMVNDVSYAYPNPCRNGFYLNIDVKLGSSATFLLLDSQHTIHKTYLLEDGYQLLYVQVSNLEPGLYRAFICFADGYYSYGDVLIQD